MKFLLAIYLVMVASYAEQAVPAVTSRGMIAKAKNGEHTFGFVFRHFAATKDLGGMHRLLWDVKTPDDLSDIYQLLLANNDDDAELADNSYTLLRKIIRNTSGRGQAAYIAKSIIAEKLHDVLYDLRDKIVAFHLASVKLGKDGNSVGEKLNEELAGAIDAFNEEYQNFSFVYLNVTQGSRRVGTWIRNYFNYQAKDIVRHLLDESLFSEPTHTSIANRTKGGLKASLNILCSLAINCRHHGPRDDRSLELINSIGELSSDVAISNIWP